MSYQVKTELFSGPLEKLLELIEAQKLEISQINLAEVTADFLKYLESFSGGAGPDVLADFLVVAGKLILIKSKILLPNLELTEEEKSDIHDLELQLKLYQQFKRAAENIKKIWGENKQSYSRDFFAGLGEAKVFYPPPNLTADDLTRAIRRLVSSIRALLPEATATVKRLVVTLESKIKELTGRMAQAAETSFKKAVSGKAKIEIIVSFLALLHLLRERIVKVEQNEIFGDIIFGTHLKNTPSRDTDRFL